jgi:hypothetical protein
LKTDFQNQLPVAQQKKSAAVKTAADFLAQVNSA